MTIQADGSPTTTDAAAEARADLLSLEQPLFDARMAIAILWSLCHELLTGGDHATTTFPDPRSGECKIETDVEFANTIIWWNDRARDYIRTLDDRFHALADGGR